MSDLAKAELREMKPDFSDEDKSKSDRTVVVQFNPETLKVSFANQIQQPEGGGDKRGSQSQLFVGSGTTKLSCTLWFDVNAPQSKQPDPSAQNATDVRKLTNRVSYFITPRPDDKDKKKFVPPALRFIWGSFQFDGIIESLEETLELFSPEGRPLRASVALGMSQQKILVFPPKDLGPVTRRQPGTRPTTPVPQRTPVQKLAGEGWQSVAQDNNVENPRLPTVGLRLEIGGG